VKKSAAVLTSVFKISLLCVIVLFCQLYILYAAASLCEINNTHSQIRKPVY